MGIRQLNMVEFKYFLAVSDPLILEIGANDGSSTEKFTRIFPRPKYIVSNRTHAP